MHLYAAWPIKCSAEDRTVLVYGREDTHVVIHRPVGRGNVVVVGDTFLAVNENLELREGPIDENVRFWRWLISRATGGPEWLPPNPSADAEPSKDGEGNDSEDAPTAEEAAS